MDSVHQKLLKSIHFRRVIQNIKMTCVVYTQCSKCRPTKLIAPTVTLKFDSLGSDSVYIDTWGGVTSLLQWAKIRSPCFNAPYSQCKTRKSKSLTP